MGCLWKNKDGIVEIEEAVSDATQLPAQHVGVLFANVDLLTLLLLPAAPPARTSNRSLHLLYFLVKRRSSPRRSPSARPVSGHPSLRGLLLNICVGPRLAAAANSSASAAAGRGAGARRGPSSSGGRRAVDHLPVIRHVY
ncbi:hypothetical protein EVAR_21126_1 [Eumeta japonica]|uniref:Uncharacterized protein n=1 Tax=Eumeta variegata TaxID=151549 RepID=A0A4C1VUS5_EUMVA|nr:hypothetical protein EVAR_21126_1 [Eumeta japonica]